MQTLSARTRSDLPKEGLLTHGVALLADALSVHEPPAACFVLANALFCHLQQPGDKEALEKALFDTLSGLGGDQTPLFADAAPLPLKLGAPSVPELTETLNDLFSAQAWSYEDGELLGGLFETHLSSVQRKKHGAFYTPAPIVEYLLEATLPPKHLPLAKDFRLLDPSCGAGNFLSLALEALFERVWTSQTGAEGRYLRLKRVMDRHLFGVDLNPWALKLAQIRLAFVQLKLVPELKVPLKANLLGRNTLQQHDATLEPGFDVIVGNPPYGAEISSQDKHFFQRHYRLGNGRQDTTALFIERSARLLRDKGRLGLVVPHGVTRTGAYYECRRLLVEDMQLTALLDLGAAFPGVNLETIAFVAEHRQADLRHAALPWAPDDQGEVRLDTFRDGTFRALGTQSHGFFRNRPTMPIYANRTSGGWITKVEVSGVPLQHLAWIRRGAGISAKESAIALWSEGTPVVRGRDIRRYGGDEGLLRLSPRYALRDRFLNSVLSAPRIVYQNIASAVVATLLPSGSLPLDTVNVLEPQSDWNPHYLLALLNSRLLEAYFQLVIANKAQLTLHLDTPTLGSLPLMIATEREQRAIASEAALVLDWLAQTSRWDLSTSLAEALWETPEALEAATRERLATMELRRKRALEALEAIDAQVFDLYGITEAEREAVCAETTPKRLGSNRQTPVKEISKIAEGVIVQGLMRALEDSDRPRDAFELYQSWARPDHDAIVAVWGGDPSADLPGLLAKYGAMVHGTKVGLWQPGLQGV